MTVPSRSLAQYDSIVNAFKKEFNSFNQSIQQKHQGFMEKNDSIFFQFLKCSWASFDVLYKSKPTPFKPVAQPKVEQNEGKDVLPSLEIKTDSSQIDSTLEPTKTETQFKKNNPITPTESIGAAILNIDFYGNESKLSYPAYIPQLKQISPESISNYFYQISICSSFPKLVTELQEVREKIKLNDWGYYKLVESVAGLLDVDPASKTLFTWAILIKSGFNAKVGFSSNSVFLLIPLKEETFNSFFLTINNQIFYIPSADTKASEIQKLTVYKADYPGNKIFSLLISQIPKVGNGYASREISFRETKYTISQNEQLISFYRDYPTCELKVYFTAPLSDSVMNSLENYFNPLFKDLTDKEKVSLLLEFTQVAFSYQSDKDQFSREKYFFPDELFFYPYSDCEDRAVLFSRLVRHFTHLNCIALDYPGHVNAAVDFKEDVRGSFITVNGSKYTVCDPTYINAPIGYLPSEFQGKRPKIITFE